MNIETFNDNICKLLNNIKEENGLYNYYYTRVVNKQLLTIDDQLLIKYFMENVDINTNILEIAAGIGQISHYLNKNNYKNITINECDKKRFNISMIINNHLNNTCNHINNKYQHIKLDQYDYIFTLNGVSSHLGKLDDIPIFEKLLNSGKKIILKEGYFGVYNDTTFTNKLKEKFNYIELFKTNKPILMFYKCYL